jgi:hypothetical protein
MASEIKVDKITPYTGTSLTLGESGQKYQVPSGATLANSGTVSGIGGANVVKVSSVKMTGRVAFAASGASWTEMTGLQLTHTAASTSNRLLFICTFTGTENGTSWHTKFYNNTASANPTGAVHPGEGSRPGCTSKHNQNNSSWATTIPMITWVTPPNTSANQYTVMAASHSGTGYANSDQSNQNAGNADSTRTICNFTIIEIDSGGVA